MRKHVSYLRVSTQRQGHSGLGLDAQRSAVETYLAQGNGTLIAEHVEVESGSKRARPILSEALSQCRRDGAVLVIAKLDRLARNVAFVSSLMESGIEFVAVDAPYANPLMLHVMAAFAEYERELVSQRTRAALAAAKQRGVRLGINGQRLAATRQAEAREAAERMREPIGVLLDTGPQTLAALAEQLNSRGHRTRDGALWSPGTVHRLLRRLRSTSQVTNGHITPSTNRRPPPPPL